MKRTLYFLFVFVLLSVSCQKELIRDLNRIEDIIDSAPDSALFLLESIPEGRIITTEDKAMYSLLLSMALDKSYIDLQNDSIIIKAVNYYSARDISYHRMKSWYYEGVVLYNQGSYSSSIVALEKAERDALLLKDRYYLGLINSKKASIFNTWSNLSSAIDCQKKAIYYFRKAGKKEHVDYAILALGIALYNDKQYNQASAYITNLKNHTSNPLLINLCNLRLASISAETEEQPANAIELFKSIPISLFTLYDYGLYSLSWERAGILDSASVWMDRGYKYAKDEADSASLDYMFSGIEVNRGNYVKAYSLVKHATDFQDTHTKSILQESLNTALKDYYQGELTLKEERAARERDKKIWTGFLGCLVAIALSLFFIYRLKRKEQLLKQQITLYAAVKNENQDIKQENTRLIGSLFSSRLHNLDVLSKEYFTAGEKEKKEIVFNAFKRFLEEFRSDDNAFSALEHDLDLYADGIMRKLVEQVPRINKDKRKIIALFFAGLPYETIQLITKSVSIDSLRMQRSRFRREIKDANAPDAELFLSMLDIKNVAENNKTNE